MCSTGNPTEQIKWLLFDIKRFSVCLAASVRTISRFSAQRMHPMFALISGRREECESDALAAGSREEVAGGDPDSPELPNSLPPPSSAAANRTAGCGSAARGRRRGRTAMNISSPRRLAGRQAGSEIAPRAPQSRRAQAQGGSPRSQPRPRAERAFPSYLTAAFPSE